MNIGDSATIAMLIPIVAIIGGFVLAGLGIYSGIRRREFEHRERLAMIEKGLAPTQAPGGPGPAPGGASPAFLADHEEMWRRDPFAADSMRAAQIRRGGFILTCIGIGLFLMIYLTSGEWSDALGIGTFLAILGMGIFFSSYLGGGRRGTAGSDAPRGGGRST